VEWIEQVVTAGMAPSIAKIESLTLFVQPWYGDGVNYRGIIKHDDWTLTLTARFRDLNSAKKAVEHAAAMLLSAHCVVNDD